jgi:hypothetical protein
VTVSLPFIMVVDTGTSAGLPPEDEAVASQGCYDLTYGHVAQEMDQCAKLIAHVVTPTRGPSTICAALREGKLPALFEENLDTCLGRILKGGKSLRLGVAPRSATTQRVDPGAPAAVVLLGEFSGKYLGRHRGNRWLTRISI